MIENLAQILEHSAVCFPDKEAFKCLDDSLTYNDLNAKSDQLACHLVNEGLRKGDRVGIYMNRCLDYSIAVYGILKAGGAFVAINPHLPKNRTVDILSDCGIEHLITIPTLARKLLSVSKGAHLLKSIIGISDNLGLKTISWDSIFSISIKNQSRPEILRKDLASILYTSGSTGVPKGIMHTHDSLLNLARLEVNLHDATENDILGNFAPLHFDQSLFGLFAGPLVGAKTVIFPDSYVKLPASLSALVAKEKITLWFSVPSILLLVLKNGQIEEHDFSSLRLVRFGGEVFPVKQLRELMQKWPHAKFINSYGPSEIVRCTYYFLEKPPTTDAPIPLGTVWGDTEYLIIDENGKNVKSGQPGELVIKTTTMMAGYWNNQELTEASLFKIEVSKGLKQVYYRTGDLVRENDNNELMFLGRMDRQVKLRGNRIELGEIEAVLTKHEFVESAAAVLVEKNGAKEIQVVVSLFKNVVVDIKELKLFCKERLPKYAVPNDIQIVSNMPRNANGKIDREKIKECYKVESK